jgi:hypothetical protein
MGADPLTYLDTLGAIKTGFNIGQQIQENRARAQDRQNLAELRMEQLYNQRQQEARLRQQQEALIQERELDRVAKEAVLRDSQGARVDFYDAMRAGAEPSQAAMMAFKRNRNADPDVAREFEKFIPTPTTIERVQVGDDEAVLANGRQLVSPSGRDTAPVRTASAFADAEIAAGRATEAERPALIANQLSKEPAPVRNANAVVKTMVDGGLLPADKAKETVAKLAKTGGTFLRPPAATILKLDERVATIELADQLDKDLTEFDQKFGNGALDEYVGGFDVPLDKALDFMRKRGTPKDVEALRIFQNFANIKNGKIKTISGATVTADEGKRTDASIGSVLNKNFVNQFRNFRQNERSTFKSTIDSFQDYQLPDNWKAAATGAYKAGEAAAAPVVRSQSEYDALPKGSKFIDASGKVKTKR